MIIEHAAVLNKQQINIRTAELPDEIYVTINQPVDSSSHLVKPENIIGIASHFTQDNDIVYADITLYNTLMGAIAQQLITNNVPVSFNTLGASVLSSGGYSYLMFYINMTNGDLGPDE